LPLIILIAGLFGQPRVSAWKWYANTLAIPWTLAAARILMARVRADAFEIGVLFAVLAGISAIRHQWIATPIRPIDECEAMRQAMRDGWLVAICSDTPATRPCPQDCGRPRATAIG